MPAATNAVRVDSRAVVQCLYRVTQNVVYDDVATAVVTNADVSNAGLRFTQSSHVRDAKVALVLLHTTYE